MLQALDRRFSLWEMTLAKELQQSTETNAHPRYHISNNGMAAKQME